ncbi:transmembrane protein 161B [Topomyia yanbarensis]|uniref:transmembrane protein 161B n=1 Tax=Topomyia yanbarensis TaxID=2498891 RepID=UPI00273C8EC3|nr:transmembrane protein 161B [Topomyia yanbarensis]
MALLGAQLVITLIMVSVIQKVSPHFSLAKWILCSTGLIRYLHPTDDELRKLSGVPREKTKSRKDKRGNGHVEVSDRPSTFHVPRSLDVQLETVSIAPYDIIHLRYYTEYQWIVDFSLYATIVYAISETYTFFFPMKEEFNLSMLWCLLVIFFAFKLLASLTIQYFQSDESIGERSTCIVTGLVYLLIAMMILIVPETTLEVGLVQAYKSFNESASVFLESQGLQSSGPASEIVVKFFIAVGCGILGALFTFPGLRMARMHWDSLKFCQDKALLKFGLNLSFAMPFLLVLLWIKPLSRDYLTVRVFSGMSAPLLSSEAFETIRLDTVVFAVLLRFVLMPVYLQAYLNLAYDRIEDQKKEAGRITNVDLQKKITSIFYYLCVVTLQYVAPILMCLFFTLMYKTLGEYTWTGFLKEALPPNECSADLETQRAMEVAAAASLESNASSSDDTSILSTAETIQLSLQSLKSVFTKDVYRGLLGFATWWCCFSWFAATSLGMVYQSYFTKS